MFCIKQTHRQYTERIIHLRYGVHIVYHEIISRPCAKQQMHQTKKVKQTKPIFVRQLARRRSSLRWSLSSLNMWLVCWLMGCCCLRLFGSKILLISHSHSPTAAAGTNNEWQSQTKRIARRRLYSSVTLTTTAENTIVFNLRTHSIDSYILRRVVSQGACEICFKGIFGCVLSECWRFAIY